MLACISSLIRNVDCPDQPWCGSLNVIGPHNLREIGTIMTCDSIGVGIALLEDVHHCEGRL